MSLRSGAWGDYSLMFIFSFLCRRCQKEETEKVENVNQEGNKEEIKEQSK